MQKSMCGTLLGSRWVRHGFFLVNLLWLPLPALATPLQQDVTTFKSWIITCLAVIVVGGGGFLLVRKKAGVAWRSGGDLRIQSVLSLGMKEKLVLIQVEDKRLLLGVTQQQITLISNLTSETQDSFTQRFEAMASSDSVVEGKE